MTAASNAAARVMTWNIHGALGRNPRFDLTRVVEIIRRWHPDIVALQEVNSRRGLAGGANAFEFLLGAVGLYGIGAKSLITQDGDYGQMLISRWPILAQEVRDISFGEREPRRAIRAEVDGAGRPTDRGRDPPRPEHPRAATSSGGVDRAGGRR